MGASASINTSTSNSGFADSSLKKSTHGTSFDAFLSHDLGLDFKGRNTHERVRILSENFWKERGISCCFDNQRKFDEISRFDGSCTESFGTTAHVFPATKLKKSRRLMKIFESIHSSQCVVIFITKRYIDLIDKAYHNINESKTANLEDVDGAVIEYFFALILKGMRLIIPVLFDEAAFVALNQKNREKKSSSKQATGSKRPFDCLWKFFDYPEFDIQGSDIGKPFNENFESRTRIIMMDFEANTSQIDDLTNYIIRKINPFKTQNISSNIFDISSPTYYTISTEQRIYSWLKCNTNIPEGQARRYAELGMKASYGINDNSSHDLKLLSSDGTNYLNIQRLLAAMQYDDKCLIDLGVTPSDSQMIYSAIKKSLLSNIGVAVKSIANSTVDLISPDVSNISIDTVHAAPLPNSKLDLNRGSLKSLEHIDSILLEYQPLRLSLRTDLVDNPAIQSFNSDIIDFQPDNSHRAADNPIVDSSLDWKSSEIICKAQAKFGDRSERIRQEELRYILSIPSVVQLSGCLRRNIAKIVKMQDEIQLYFLCHADSGPLSPAKAGKSPLKFDKGTMTSMMTLRSLVIHFDDELRSEIAGLTLKLDDIEDTNPLVEFDKRYPQGIFIQPTKNHYSKERESIMSVLNAADITSDVSKYIDNFTHFLEESCHLFFALNGLLLFPNRFYAYSGNTQHSISRESRVDWPSLTKSKDATPLTSWFDPLTYQYDAVVHGYVKSFDKSTLVSAVLATDVFNYAKLLRSIRESGIILHVFILLKMESKYDRHFAHPFNRLYNDATYREVEIDSDVSSTLRHFLVRYRTYEDHFSPLIQALHVITRLINASHPFTTSELQQIRTLPQLYDEIETNLSLVHSLHFGEVLIKLLTMYGSVAGKDSVIAAILHCLSAFLSSRCDGSHRIHLRALDAMSLILSVMADRGYCSYDVHNQSSSIARRDGVMNVQVLSSGVLCLGEIYNATERNVISKASAERLCDAIAASIHEVCKYCERKRADNGECRFGGSFASHDISLSSMDMFDCEIICLLDKALWVLIKLATDTINKYFDDAKECKISEILVHRCNLVDLLLNLLEVAVLPLAISNRIYHCLSSLCANSLDNKSVTERYPASRVVVRHLTSMQPSNEPMPLRPHNSSRHVLIAGLSCITTVVFFARCDRDMTESDLNGLTGFSGILAACNASPSSLVEPQDGSDTIEGPTQRRETLYCSNIHQWVSNGCCELLVYLLRIYAQCDDESEEVNKFVVRSSLVNSRDVCLAVLKCIARFVQLSDGVVCKRFVALGLCEQLLQAWALFLDRRDTFVLASIAYIVSRLSYSNDVIVGARNKFHAHGLGELLMRSMRTYSVSQVGGLSNCGAMVATESATRLPVVVALLVEVLFALSRASPVTVEKFRFTGLCDCLVAMMVTTDKRFAVVLSKSAHLPEQPQRVLLADSDAIPLSQGTFSARDIVAGSSRRIAGARAAGLPHPTDRFHEIDERLVSIVNEPALAWLTEPTQSRNQTETNNTMKTGDDAKITLPEISIIAGKRQKNLSQVPSMRFPIASASEENVIGIHFDKSIWCIDQLYSMYGLQ